MNEDFSRFFCSAYIDWDIVCQRRYFPNLTQSNCDDLLGLYCAGGEL